MKYTKANSGVLMSLLAIAALIAPAGAQSAYVSGAPSLSAYNSVADSPDDSQGAMITIRSRVN